MKKTRSDHFILGLGACFILFPTANYQSMVKKQSSAQRMTKAWADTGKQLAHSTNNRLAYYGLTHVKTKR